MTGTFYACDKLGSVWIPNTVTNIAPLSFYGCKNLRYINVEWTTPPDLHSINPDFSDYNNCTLIVPKGTRSLYISIWYWNHFIEIVERDGGTAAEEVSASPSVVSVSASSGRFYVDSPTSETVYVYSFTGKLLHSSRKEAGKAEFDLPEYGKLLIVRGSSGWARKLMVNY
jgi:hypothetical protein